jgi:cytidine deaminase
MKHQIEVSPIVANAFKIAIKAQENSHSPYSHFAVGAALKFKNDEFIYPGCNVENASYGGTICAERTAVCSRVANKGKGYLEFAVVLAHTTNPTYPCAMCLQVFSEFCEEDFPIYMGNENGLLKKMTFKDFLPHSFDTLSEGQRS